MLLDRCTALEGRAGAIYALLAERFLEDPALRRLWEGMAADEREHARKLATWRAVVAAEDPARWPSPIGFDASLAAVEELAADAQTGAARCTTADEAFALALALETSELDAIYTQLLQNSPIARFPDIDETIRSETAGHHDALVCMVKARSRDEGNLLRAEVLMAHEVRARHR
ncbi:MAG TPA: hypothetical protein VGK30_00410 [Candidatus Binatia bacterium]